MAAPFSRLPHPQFASPANTSCLPIRACKPSFTFYRYAKVVQYFKKEVDKSVNVLYFQIEMGIIQGSLY
jgi:hypothetical protein